MRRNNWAAKKALEKVKQRRSMLVQQQHSAENAQTGAQAKNTFVADDLELKEFNECLLVGYQRDSKMSVRHKKSSRSCPS